MATDLELLSGIARRRAAQAEAGMFTLEEGFDLPSRIEYMALRPLLTEGELETLCANALAWKFAAVCVPLPWIGAARGLLSSGSVAVAAAVSYPLGTSPVGIQEAETRCAIDSGAQEISVTLAHWKLKKDTSELRREMESLRELSEGVSLSFTVETCMLSDEEMITAVRLAELARANWVRSGSGLWKNSAIGEIALLKSAAPDSMKICAAAEKERNGSRNILPLFAAGADRISTSSPLELLQDTSLSPEV